MSEQSEAFRNHDIRKAFEEIIVQQRTEHERIKVNRAANPRWQALYADDEYKVIMVEIRELASHKGNGAVFDEGQELLAKREKLANDYGVSFCGVDSAPAPTNPPAAEIGKGEPTGDANAQRYGSVRIGRNIANVWKSFFNAIRRHHLKSTLISILIVAFICVEIYAKETVWRVFNAAVSNPLISTVIGGLIFGFICIGVYRYWGLNLLDPSSSRMTKSPPMFDSQTKPDD